ncbi:hypothetical protein CLV32_4009 [Pedobacter duraquae]|uniref:Copper-binding protein MbnP-like domain-containing protein n=2 Tax=Pedobacter duraquae TaxID=425511 RepID=A0A4V3C300_9SPHI|nr:hypothetical protein CLV32_4009 [Pedobacter duraquae]
MHIQAIAIADPVGIGLAPLYHISEMKKLLTIISLSALLFTSCSKDDDNILAESEGKATVSFDAMFGSQDFALNKGFTVGSNTLTFNKLRYWVSNVVLVNSKNEEFKVPSSYYLIEETNAINLTGVNNDLSTTVYPATKREDVVLKEIPAGDYKSIRFSIGVEQKYNDNLSLQTGELSQLNGMTNVSWMWLTSYIYTSLGGTITNGTTSKTLKVETGLNANYKTVTLDFPAAVRISSTKATNIVLNADISKAIDGLDVYSTNTVGGSQAAAMTTVATNYATKVFSVKSVK